MPHVLEKLQSTVVTGQSELSKVAQLSQVAVAAVESTKVGSNFSRWANLKIWIEMKSEWSHFLNALLSWITFLLHRIRLKWTEYKYFRMPRMNFASRLNVNKLWERPLYSLNKGSNKSSPNLLLQSGCSSCCNASLWPVGDAGPAGATAYDGAAGHRGRAEQQADGEREGDGGTDWQREGRRQAH